MSGLNNTTVFLSPGNQLHVSDTAHRHVSDTAHRHVSDTAHRHVSDTAHRHVSDTAQRHVSDTAHRHVSDTAHRHHQVDCGNKKEKFTNFTFMVPCITNLIYVEELLTRCSIYLAVYISL
jgi:hypothetical protein